jgi:hypothetical protein
MNWPKIMKYVWRLDFLLSVVLLPACLFDLIPAGWMFILPVCVVANIFLDVLADIVGRK